MVIFCILLVLTGIRGPNIVVRCSFADEKSLPFLFIDGNLCDGCDCNKIIIIEKCVPCCPHTMLLPTELTRTHHQPSTLKSNRGIYPTQVLGSVPLNTAEEVNFTLTSIDNQLLDEVTAHATNTLKTLIDDKPRNIRNHKNVNNKPFYRFGVIIVVIITISIIVIVLKYVSKYHVRPDSDGRRISARNRTRPHDRTNRLTTSDRYDDIESQYRETLCITCLNDDLPPSYDDVCNARVHEDNPTCSLTLHSDFGHEAAFAILDALSANESLVDEQPPSYDEAMASSASHGRMTSIDFPTLTLVDPSGTTYNCIQCTPV